MSSLSATVCSGPKTKYLGRLNTMYVFRGKLNEHSQGTLHLKSHGSEERASILSLHDDTEGIVVAEKCPGNPSTGSPELAEQCSELLPRYDAYDYELLMNSTFGLAPAGSLPGTHRLAEASKIPRSREIHPLIIVI